MQDCEIEARIDHPEAFQEIKKFMDFFSESKEYPQVLQGEILPWNECWWYVASSFLSGVINYQTAVKKAFLLNRYYDWDELDQREIEIRENPNQPNPWVKFTGTKKQIYEKIISKPDLLYHVNIGMFGDDALILFEIKDGDFGNEKAYLFIWNDMDCSDCAIGRFRTSLPEEQVVKLFEEYCLDRAKDCALEGTKPSEYIKELPESIFRGWLSC